MSTITVTVLIQPGKMSCAACSTTVRNTINLFLQEKKISFSGIRVDIPSNSAKIFDVILQNSQAEQDLYCAISEALRDVGFDCVPYQEPSIKMNFLSSSLSYSMLPLGGALMLTEYMHWLPSPSSSRGLPINLSIGIMSTILSLYFVQDHVKNAWRRQSAMDALISIGVISSILYSFALIAYPPFFEDDDSSLCFSLPLLILGFLKFSHALRNQIHMHIEAQIDAIDFKKNKLPQVANTKLSDDIEAGEFTQQPVDKIAIGSILRVENGAIIPIDATLLGEKKIDVKEDFYGNKALTSKKSGDTIFAGTENTSGESILVTTICESKNNHLNQLYTNCITKPVAHPYLEWVSQYFLRSVMATAILSAVFWGFFGPPPASSHAIKVFIAVTLSACPCGFGLININASMIKALALEKNILIQKDNVLDIDQATDICLDKCGTLTEGKYSLEKLVSVDEKSLDDISKHKYLYYAMLLEEALAKESATPVSRAIIEAGKKNQQQNNVSSHNLSQFSHNPNNKGRGGIGMIDGQSVTLGNQALLRHQKITIDPEWTRLAAVHSQRNRLPIFLAVDDVICCLLILQSATEETQILRDDATSVINTLIQSGKIIHILTGDSLDRTQFILPLNEEMIIKAEQTPQDKMNYVSTLKSNSKKVIMLGDDSNDLGAINMSDYGLAIDAFAPIRSEADAVLNGSFISLLQLICLAKTYRQSYAISLLLIFGINGISLFAAAGIFYPIQRQFVDPMITSLAMIVSSLLLLINIACFKYIGTRRLEKITFDTAPLALPSTSYRYFSCCNNKRNSHKESSLLLNEFNRGSRN